MDDEATIMMRAIRERLEADTASWRRNTGAWVEWKEREERWRQLCPPDHRRGNHLRLSTEDCRSTKASFQRQTTPELKAERFTHAGLPNDRVTVHGLMDPGETTLTKVEYLRLRQDSNPHRAI